VFGNGWDKSGLPSNTRIEIHPSVSYKQVQEIMCDTQMVLTVLPNFKYGGHERIFSSMLSGAVAVSDSNAYLEQSFQAGLDFVPFSLAHLDKLREQVGTLLENPAAMEEIARSGSDAVVKRHLWKHRAEQIIETVKFHYTFYPLH
jgi:spore maturation protein CgeB